MTHPDLPHGRFFGQNNEVQYRQAKVRLVLPDGFVVEGTVVQANLDHFVVEDSNRMLVSVRVCDLAPKPFRA